VFLHGFSGNEDDWSAWFPSLPDGVVGASLRAPAPVGDRWAWVRFDEPGMSTSRLLSSYAAAARGVGELIERRHAGIRASRPPVWYGMGGRDDVISPAWRGAPAAGSLTTRPPLTEDETEG
jgi:hypothetical protein